MKVRELIIILQKFDGEDTVTCHDGEWEDFYHPIDVYRVPADRVTGGREGDYVVKISPLTKDNDYGI